MTATKANDAEADRNAPRRVVRRLLLWAVFIVFAVATAGVLLVGMEEFRRRDEVARLEVEAREAAEAFGPIYNRWVRESGRPDYVRDPALERDHNEAYRRVRAAESMLLARRFPVWLALWKTYVGG